MNTINPHPLENSRAIEIVREHHDITVPVVLGISGGVAVAAVVMVAGAVAIVAACIFFPTGMLIASLSVLACVGLGSIVFGVALGFGLGAEIAKYVDDKPTKIEIDLKTATSPEEVVQITAKIKNNNTVAALAREMNQEQFESLGTALGTDRFSVITQLINRPDPNQDL